MKFKKKKLDLQDLFYIAYLYLIILYISIAISIVTDANPFSNIVSANTFPIVLRINRKNQITKSRNYPIQYEA